MTVGRRDAGRKLEQPYGDNPARDGATANQVDQDGAAPTRSAPDEHHRSPLLGVAASVRWTWRTLTSMRTALVLLALLALAAVPGSLLPQRGVASDPSAVVRFARNYPTLAPWLERLGMFDVYSSAWFAAIYLLLLTSTAGCVLPRCLKLWRAAQAAPPRAPAKLQRLHGYRQWTTEATAPEVVTAVSDELRRRRFRIRVDDSHVRAEKGYLRELGNLTFHLSLLVLLVGVATGKLYGFEGTVIVVEGAGFANTRSQYDTFLPGPLHDESRMTPFSLALTDMAASFEAAGPQRGNPLDFTADVEVEQDGESGARTARIKVNEPLEVSGTKVFLTGNGYAPRVTVRDGRGRTVFTGPVVFLPRDGNYASEGVVKVPDAEPTQMGFEGFFLPTAAVGSRGPFSAFPDALNPQLFLTAYTGDLGLSDGIPQSVYTLKKDQLTQVRVDGKPLARALRVGDTMRLPDGQGSIRFDGFARFANFQIARDPGKEVALAAAVMLLGGLTTSLAVRRRRIWVRVRPISTGSARDGSVVEVGALALTRRGLVEGELEALARAVSHRPGPDDRATPRENASLAETTRK